MKTFKQLLWFIIPTVIAIILFCLLTFGDTSNFPRFVGRQDYFRLLMNDPIFLQAIINSISLPLIYGLFSGGAIFAIKLFLLKSKLNVLYYATLFVIPTTIFYFTSDLSKAMGLPLSVYSSHTIVSYEKSFNYINVPSILISAQVGILICFLFWIVEKIIYKVRRKINAGL